jgi:hypothetical protein
MIKYKIQHKSNIALYSVWPKAFKNSKLIWSGIFYHGDIQWRSDIFREGKWWDGSWGLETESSVLKFHSLPARLGNCIRMRLHFTRGVMNPCGASWWHERTQILVGLSNLVGSKRDVDVKVHTLQQLQWLNNYKIGIKGNNSLPKWKYNWS